MLRIGTYNVEHFDNLFGQDNALSDEPVERARLEQLALVFQTIDADLVGIVEAPNTTANANQRTVDKLEAFARFAEIRASRARTGFLSPGRQEIAALFDPDTLRVDHCPGGRAGSRSNPKFDEEFRVDTDRDRIDEIYEHYRPPLELLVTGTASGATMRVMVVHAKSKGIFDAVDQANLQRESDRNRRKLIAECASIRNRVEQWLDDDERVVVMGDMNDGPGLDFYEQAFDLSAVEIIMGDLFKPARVLVSPVGKPKFGRFGWEPSSARFRDRITEDLINVLIDHILVSQDVAVLGHRVWNPFQNDEAAAIKPALQQASDHFPITVDIDL